VGGRTASPHSAAPAVRRAACPSKAPARLSLLMSTLHKSRALCGEQEASSAGACRRWPCWPCWMSYLWCDDGRRRQRDSIQTIAHVGHQLPELLAGVEGVLGCDEVGGRQKVLQWATCNRGLVLCQESMQGCWSQLEAPACSACPNQTVVGGRAKGAIIPGAAGVRTCVAATRISPFLGVHRLACTPIRDAASARASWVCSTGKRVSVQHV
jgi:hypothetical protein